MEGTNNQKEKTERIIKLKTLDNKMIELKVDSEIKIKELKNIISQKFDNISIDRERLIFKGKQLKDEEKLSDHISKDNEIIHLMFKTIEQTQQNQNTNNNNSNSNQNNNNNNGFTSVLTGLLNNPAVMNLTNALLGNFERQNPPVAEIINRSSNPNAGNILFQQEQSRNNNNVRTQTRIINLNRTTFTTQNNNNQNNNTQNNNTQNNNNQNNNTQNNNTQNNNNQNNNTQNNNTQNNINQNNNQSNINQNNPNLTIEKINEGNKFPIKISEVDKNYEHLLKDTNSKITKSIEDIRKEVPRINLPLLNSNQNVLTAISRTIRHYILMQQELIPNLMRLSELMEREQYILNEQDRKNVNELLKKCTDSLEDTASASEGLKKILKSTNFGIRPNQGFIGILNAINTVPITVTRNVNNNVNQNNQNNQNINNNYQNNNQNNQNNNNNNQNDNQNNNNNNNNRESSGQQNNSNQGNIYSNIMTQILNPNNLNNLVGMVDDMLSGGSGRSNNNNNNNNNNQSNQSSGGLFSNLISGIMSGLNDLDSSDEDNENQRNEEEKKEEEKKEEPKQEEIKEEKKNDKKKEENEKEELNQKEIKEEKKEEEKKEENKTEENKSIIKKPDLELLKKLMESPSTRKSTKLKDMKEISPLNPNKEFEKFTNEIISNFTLQDIVNLNTLNISGIIKQRKEIQLLINDNIEESIKKLTELITERIILMEDSNNKLKENNFDIEKFVNDNLIEFIKIINNKEISDNDYYEKLRNNLLKIFNDFYKELSKIYLSGIDGAKFCLKFSIENICNDLVGEDFINVMKNYNENLFTSFLDNLIFISENLELKNELENNNNQSLNIEHIFNIALRDKKILEEEEKKKNDLNNGNKDNEVNEEDKFSEFYYRTSLFQS